MTLDRKMLMLNKRRKRRLMILLPWSGPALALHEMDNTTTGLDSSFPFGLCGYMIFISFSFGKCRICHPTHQRHLNQGHINDSPYFSCSRSSFTTSCGHCPLLSRDLSSLREDFISAAADDCSHRWCFAKCTGGSVLLVPRQGVLKYM